MSQVRWRRGNFSMTQGRRFILSFPSTPNLRSFAAASELAFARYRDPIHLAAIDRGRRSGEVALLFGDAELPKAKPREHRSVNFGSSINGVAMCIVPSTSEDAISPWAFPHRRGNR